MGATTKDINPLSDTSCQVGSNPNRYYNHLKPHWVFIFFFVGASWQSLHDTSIRCQNSSSVCPKLIVPTEADVWGKALNQSLPPLSAFLMENQSLLPTECNCNLIHSPAPPQSSDDEARLSLFTHCETLPAPSAAFAYQRSLNTMGQKWEMPHVCKFEQWHVSGVLVSIFHSNMATGYHN